MLMIRYVFYCLLVIAACSSCRTYASSQRAESEKVYLKLVKGGQLEICQAVQRALVDPANDNYVTQQSSASSELFSIPKAIKDLRSPDWIESKEEEFIKLLPEEAKRLRDALAQQNGQLLSVRKLNADVVNRNITNSILRIKIKNTEGVYERNFLVENDWTGLKRYFNDEMSRGQPFYFRNTLFFAKYPSDLYIHQMRIKEFGGVTGGFTREAVCLFKKTKE